MYDRASCGMLGILVLISRPITVAGNSKAGLGPCRNNMCPEAVHLMQDLMPDIRGALDCRKTAARSSTRPGQARAPVDDAIVWDAGPAERHLDPHAELAVVVSAGGEGGGQAGR